jgi:NTP pyrophosphatase (non-canonical NTP hydrolase)
MYTLYHIPGKKIGVTRDLTRRVTQQQGYAADEYEVLLTSDDIDFISNMEIELQKSYGYKVDRQTYKNLINKSKMNINATEQTSTFPVPLNKLKGRLMDCIGTTWQTSYGSFVVTEETIPWLFKNAVTSMFNENRCYIYNKSYHRQFIQTTTDDKQPEEAPNVYDLIRQWAKNKGIYDKGDSKTQYLKLMEEAGELAEALLKKDRPEIIDAIGDMVVVLTNLAKLENLEIEDCVRSAYDVIKNRKGKMENGTFVKTASRSFAGGSGVLNYSQKQTL